MNALAKKLAQEGGLARVWFVRISSGMGGWSGKGEVYKKDLLHQNEGRPFSLQGDLLLLFGRV